MNMLLWGLTEMTRFQRGNLSRGKMSLLVRRKILNREVEAG